MFHTVVAAVAVAVAVVVVVVVVVDEVQLTRFETGQK